MITTNLFRKARAVVTKVETVAYEVLVAFHLKHVPHEAGAVVNLTDAEAKYHLLAGRIAPVADKAPEAPAEAPAAAPAPAPAAPAPAAPKAAVADKPASTAPEADGGKK